MTFEEIKEIIRNLKTDEQIKEFVNLRIEELEKTSVETTAGVEYTDTFDDYIGSKVHYKNLPRIGEAKLVLPELVYDDYEPYYEIIRALSKSSGEYNEYTIYPSIAIVLEKYFCGEQDEKSPMDRAIERAEVYVEALNNGESEISIKRFKKTNHMVWGEIAGLIQNIYKILGIPSQLVIGKINGELHAFNIIFRYGYNRFPAALVDYTDPIVLFIPELGIKSSYPLICGFDEETYSKLLKGEGVEFNPEDLVEMYKKVQLLENSILVSGKLIYSIGNDSYVNNQEINNSNKKKELKDEDKKDTDK